MGAGTMRNPAVGAFAFVCCALALALSGADSQAGFTLERDRDCADFPSQAAAQEYFDDNGGSPSNNYDALDGDGDGVVCESNPCPCAEPGEGSGDGGGGDGGSGGGSGSVKKQRARVVAVTDGDTIRVRVGGRERDVRLIGIDTPEVYPDAECGGAQAEASMRQLLSPGDRVRLLSDRSQDSRDVYGRLLRYVERRGNDVGRKQVGRGWAEVYVFETPFTRVGGYRRSSDKAESRDRGAWKRCGGDFHQPL